MGTVRFQGAIMEDFRVRGVVLSPCVQTFIDLLLNEAPRSTRESVPDVFRVKKLPYNGQPETAIESIQRNRPSELYRSHRAPSLAWQSSVSEDQRAQIKE